MKRLIVSAVAATLHCAAVTAAPVDAHNEGRDWRHGIR
jgi:hypothetical protein